jgi:HEAT repeat protein
VEPLIVALVDGDQGIRRSATEALVKIGAPAVEPLIVAFKDQDVRKYAASALVHIGIPAVEPLMAALRDGAQGVLVRTSAAEALGQIGAPAVEPLIAALKDGDQGVLVRTSAADALVNVGAPAVEPLIAALKDGDQGARKYAARALGQIGDSRVVGPLIAALKDGDQSIRRYATEALVDVGAPAVEPLIAAFKDQDVRKYVARALGYIGDARAVEPLIAALKDGDQGIRRSATGALVKIGAPAVEPLIAAFKDQDVRKYVARALGRIGDPRAAEPLSAGLKDQNGDVRTAAAEALGHIGAPAVEPLMAAFKYQGVRRYATEALAHIGAPAVEPLMLALRDEDPDVRKYAAKALGRIGDPRARKLLRGAKLDPDESVRKVATEGLAGQGLADKLRRIRVGMTEKALTDLIGRPAAAGNGAAAEGGSRVIGVAVPGEAMEPESWVFETELGDFQVVMRHGRVAEPVAGGLLDRLRPAWRTRGTQHAAPWRGEPPDRSSTL